METRQSDQFLEEKSAAYEEEAPKPIITISAISFDFDLVTTDTSKSRADEIKVLLVKNKKPPRKSKEGKPAGFGLPTGQLESKEGMLEALKRETRDESGCSVKKIVGKVFVINKRILVDGNPTPNEIHVFLIEASESLSRIREVDEIDGSVEPWIPLRQLFEMSFAQDRNGSSRNTNGIYFSHLLRLYTAIESMVFHPEDLIDGVVIKQWLKPNRKHLKDGMNDIEKTGLLDNFLPDEPEKEIPV